MNSSSDTNVTVTKGNILASQAQAIVNTVNCVGVMGKGIALAFKRAYPDMFKDYVKRCDRKEVQLGRPYPYFADDHVVINFPTKQHWRSVSRLEDIEEGLRYLKSNLEQWGITSIAVPPLGCGNGQLDWSVVRPVLMKHLSTFPIRVFLYVPHDVELEETQLSLLEPPQREAKQDNAYKVESSLLALVEILRVIEEDSYHWPVGRVMFQKLAYFATVAGIPTGLQYEAGSFGPYSETLTKHVARLQNNGLVREQKQGPKFVVSVGDAYKHSRDVSVRSFDESWYKVIHRVADLMARFDTTQAEIAATVHYTASALRNRLDRRPYAREVIEAVERWKMNRKPPLKHDDISRAIVSLATQGWIEVDADESVTKRLEALNDF